MDRRTAISLIGGAVATLAPRAGAWPQTPVVVRVGGNVDDGLTPLLYALHAGAFAPAGLEVRLQTTGNGAAFAAAIAGGSLDVAKSSLMSIVSGYARGIPFKIVAGVALYTSANPTTRLCALKNGPVRALADMSGKTIAVSSIKALDMVGTQALIDQNGGNAATTQFIELPFSAMFPALERGRVEVAAIAEPHLAAAVASGKVQTFVDPYDGISKRFVLAAWFTSADYAARNPDVTARFTRVILGANAYCNSHHAETVPLLADVAHLDPDVVAKMSRINAPTAPLDPDLIQPAIDAAARYKVIDAAFPAKALLL